MSQDIEVVKQAKNLFFKEAEQLVLGGEFVSLYCDLWTDFCIRKTYGDLNLLIRNILQDIWNIGTIVTRLDWMQKKACEEESLKERWMYFASVDVDHFHIELRSIMDYVAEMIAIIAPKKGQIPTSFRELKEWTAKNVGNRNRVGEELSQLIDSTTWFPLVYCVRNGIIHRGGYTLIFGEPEEGILFQIYTGTAKGLINNELIMYNEDVAYFDRYAAIYFCNLLIFLERFASILREKLKLKNYGTNPHASCSGFEILNSWMDTIIELSKDN